MSAIVLDKKFFDNNKKFELNIIDKNGKIITLKKQIDLFHILKSKHDLILKKNEHGLFKMAYLKNSGMIMFTQSLTK